MKNVPVPAANAPAVVAAPRIVPVPAVNAVVFNRDRTRVLVTRRSPRVREPGKWCLPGGHVECGETWVTAVRREVAEEVGLTVHEERLVGIYSDPSLTVTAEPVANGLPAQFIAALFEVTRYDGEVRPNEEVDEWGWFDVATLPAPMLKSHPIRVADAFAFRGEVFVR